MTTESSPHFLSSSPSFTDSGIDLETTTTSTATTVELSDSIHSDDDDSIIRPIPPTGHATTASSLNERISYIAHLAAENYPLRKFSVDEHAAIEKCLGDLETLLLDPRPGISRVIALNRPSSSSPSLSRTETPTPATTSTSTRKNLVLRRKEEEEEEEGEEEEKISLPRKNQIAAQTSAELKSVLGALTSVNEELQQRYLESRHIHDLFITKCEGLAQRIIELENEVHELKSDIVEDTIELEGLRGTIRGLESWVNRWQRQREASSSSSSSSNSVRRPKKNSWRWRKQSTQHDHADNEGGEEEGNDFDTFLDGVLAWMRGWNDVEEGFLIRARRRKMRRDLKSSTAR